MWQNKIALAFAVSVESDHILACALGNIKQDYLEVGKSHSHKLVSSYKDCKVLLIELAVKNGKAVVTNVLSMQATYMYKTFNHETSLKNCCLAVITILLLV